jgi:hypothetical protein
VTEVQGEDPAGDAAGGRVALPPLDDGTELLLRQVNPNFFEDGEPMNQAFRPARADEGLLSVDRESMTTPEEAFVRHTETFELRSIGVWALSVGEVMHVELDTMPDEIPGNPAHCVVDFCGLSRGQCSAKSKILKRQAVARGCLYRP